MSTSICQVASCDRPSDDWIVCKTCAKAFEQVLAEMPWLLEELDTVITQQTRYSTESSGKAAETPMMFNVKAAEMKGRLATALDTGARIVAESNGWAMNYVDATGASKFLFKRLTAIRLHASGALIVDEVTMLSIGATDVIDRPAAKQYLGDCTETYNVGGLNEPCHGKLYGKPDQDLARCDACGHESEAGPLREKVLKDLDDRLCTAAEIAHLSTYLSMRDDREKVRKRINQWAIRGLIESRESEDGSVVFRFGEVYMRLAIHDATRRSA